MFLFLAVNNMKRLHFVSVLKRTRGEKYGSGYGCGSKSFKIPSFLLLYYLSPSCTEIGSTISVL
jgi:hypothetical protein